MAAWQRRSARNKSGIQRSRKLGIEQLELRTLLAAQPIISEFLASNNGVIQDEDGDYSDFIELYNRGDAAVNLGGWYLTDDAAELTKWRIPSVNLASGQYLVVFASDKNRAVAGRQLHTNFALSTEGEYLALVQPDGITVASHFAAEFPRQYEDVSYGVAGNAAESNLVELGDTAQVLVPTTASLGTSWTTLSFAPDASWQSGALGVGYDPALGPPDSTAVLHVDFNDRTEGETGAANTEAGYSVMTLDDNGALFNGVKVTLSEFGDTSLDDRDRTGPLDAGAFTLGQVYDDVIYAVGGAAGTGMEILIEGLAPNTSYDLLLRSFDAGAAGTRQSIWTEESSGEAIVIASPYSLSGDVAPASNDDYAMRASLFSSPQGTLQLRGVQVSSDRSVMVNALELTRASFGELVGTDVKAAMHGQNASAYVRVRFAVPSVEAVGQLQLDMHYDAGFVAYLNGQEVARRNAPTAAGVPPAHTATATIERANSEAMVAETIDLTAFKALLNQGANNMLAIHGLNSAAGDEDFLIAPELRVAQLSGEALRYFETPTPGAANNSGVIDFVAEVEASVDHGFFEAPFTVTLTTPTPEAQIYYTFDGSVPTAGSAAATLYTAPVSINRTTVLRAAAVRSGYADSPVNTETYFFLDDVVTQTINPNNPAMNPFGLDYPGIWQANSVGDFNMDPDVVGPWDDHNPANQDFGIREALKSLPTMSIVLPHNDLWHQSTGIYPNATSQGDAWRRAGSIEYINPATGEEFQYNVGIQMHGAASRDNVRLKKHSFRLVFNEEFDGPGRLEFPLFEDSDFADINTVVLKASFTDSFATRTVTGRYSPLDSTYTRDVSMLDSQRAMGSLAPNATYVHLYINGLYWGLYYPTERTDDAYLSAHIGGNEDDWDIIRDFNELFRGNRIAWNAMFALVNQLPGKTDAEANAIYQQLQGRNPDGTLSAALPVYLDMDNFIDYMILHLYAGVEDWPSHNWIAARNRVDPGSGFQFFTWDQEIAWDGRYRDRTGVSDMFTPGEIYDHLRRESPEFRLRFADRVQKHMFNGGALSVAATQDRWQARADQVEAAIIAESARWGDARQGEVVNVPPITTVPLMTVNHWRASIADVHDEYIPESHPRTIERFTDDNLFPTVDAPQFSQFGGGVVEGFPLTISTTSAGATIWYTTNGQDPRLLGGAVNSGAATAYSGSVPIDGNVTVKARTLVGTTWSALTEATFISSNISGGIVISEVNYHPHDVAAAEAAAVPGVTEDDFEFIEVLNTHATDTINLQNMTLSNGLSFTFGNVSLAAGQRGVVVENEAAFIARYGPGHNIFGEWSGGASNSSETIELRDALGTLVMGLTYADIDPWSEAADGEGATLELIDPFGTSAERLNKWYSWRASTEFGGTPGGAGMGAIGVVINEVRTHSTAPELDAIELFNTTDTPINIGGWYLSDSGGSPLKYQIPAGTILAAGGFLVFDEGDFNAESLPANRRFALDGAEGDDVFLVIAGGTGGVSAIVDSVHFGAAFNGETLGRIPNGSGRLAPLEQNSLGSANGPPRVGPLVITEINYHPAEPTAAALALHLGLTATQLEFVEIYNPTNAAVDLTDYGLVGDGMFTFAPGRSIAAGQALVVVPFDPALPQNSSLVAAFRAQYGIGQSVALAGQFADALSNVGSRVELEYPDDPPPEDPTLIPKVLGDEVLYENLSPWPETASGTGNSIHRLTPIAFGNDGTNWRPAAPSPGSVSFSGIATGDFNADGKLSTADLELLVQAVSSSSTDLFYDLDENGSVNAADVAFLVNDVVKPARGDYDWDSTVTSTDYHVWRSRYGSELYLNADGNGDGRVDTADYVVWRNSLPATAASSANSTQPMTPIAVNTATQVGWESPTVRGDTHHDAVTIENGFPAAPNITAAFPLDDARPSPPTHRQARHVERATWSPPRRNDLLVASIKSNRKLHATDQEIAQAQAHSDRVINAMAANDGAWLESIDQALELLASED
jgi:hypothetical protein